MKLTKHLKSLIVQAAVKRAGVVAKETQIRLDYASWAESVITTHRGMAIEEIETKLAQANAILSTLPAGYVIDASPRLRVDTDQYFNVGGQKRIFYTNGCSTYEDAQRAGGVVSKSSTASTITVQGDCSVAQALYDIDGRADAVRDERRTIEANVRALLDSVNTDAQLLKVCPEFKTLLDEVLPGGNTPTKSLPSLQIAELVKLVGLP